MNISRRSRELKMMIHLISMYIFSVPITTHILKLALGETFIINGYSFTRFDSLLLIFIILVIVSTNIYSIVTDKQHKLTMLITGSFLSAVTMIQLVVLLFNVEMIVFGDIWDPVVSVVEVCITGSFSVLLLLSAAYFHPGKSVESLKSDKEIKFSFSFLTILNYINKLDQRIAFLLGIIFSLALSIPLCAMFYLLGNVLLNEFIMDPQRMKLLGWIGIVGMQGSIISMLLNLRRFEKVAKSQDNLSLFINALVRPFIGLSFAHLSFFMLESGLMQDVKLINGNSFSDGQLIYSFNYHVSIAFIAGFTERIARVIQPKSNTQKTMDT
ncbi:hypothetical protein [Ekhidna sp.]|uniref:hypothetical protein n=1 Tax=Ekhidna sp. TaxID=2608089 RepID=UPI003BA96B5B